FGRPWQQMAQYLYNRQPRQYHVAELPPRSVAGEDIGRRAKSLRITRPQGSQQLRLVFALAAGEARIIIGDFLQAQHVEISQRACLIDDTPQIDDAVAAASPLDVPGD